MRELGATSAVAFALATLYLLFLTGPLVSPQHQLIFHLPGPATALFAAVILDLLLAFFALFAALRLVRRHPRLELLLWALLLLPLPLVLIETIAAFAGRPPNPWTLWLAIFAAAACLSFTLVRASVLLPVFQRARPAITTVLAFVSLSGLVILSQLLWFGWGARDLNPPFVSQKSTADPASATAPRVIWVILDELSFRQLYGRRQPGLALPNFDRLASQSTVFTHADAAAEYTRIALPSLLTGRAISATSPSADGRRLLLHPRGARHWVPLDPHDTVFADLSAKGLPTAVAGWYEPYCRLLPEVLDRCFWTYSDNTPGGLSAGASVTRNAVQPFRNLFLTSLHVAGIGPGAPSEDALDVHRHAADYEALRDAGDRLLQTQTAGLIFLHMPVPHPWGFYDRRTGRFSGHRTSYLDNLALADAYIGHIRSLLEQQGSWDQSTLIIMGDHGWRAHSVWKDSGFWTAEEEQANEGAERIDRPAMIVKLAGQNAPARINSPFDAVRTRALINAVATNQVRTPQDLASWVSRAASTSH